ncbi:MAG: N-acetyl sugar amidotransferase [Candidatus Omnitrophica bacterium]|nr:N-acetyl sugar amidotransferase [Candidatus Omnitrophota bacterium]
MTHSSSKVFWCKNCLNMSTRPRITFDDRGWCNACQWMEEKRNLNWDSRRNELTEILNQYKSSSGTFDCVVPVSGGKDGSYVSYQLKHNHGMNPLAITVTPALSLDLGNKNLRNYIESGHNHIQINPNPKVMRILNRQGFIEKGFPYYGWLVAVQAAVVRLAVNLNIPLLFYGEDGEVEYGGSSESKNHPVYDIAYMKRIYLEGGHERILNSCGLSDAELYFFSFPSDRELKGKDLKITHWSYFESWDPYQNYLTAKEHCGLQEATENNTGTFTNFAQNDQALYALHTYMMYLKFGFGRATQDAGIEIRRGAMTRDQAINLVRLYDGHYPEEFIETYLDYYQMTQNEFDAVLDQWANKNLFKKENGRWIPVFTTL